MKRVFVNNGIVYEERDNGLIVKGFAKKNDKRLVLSIPDFVARDELPMAYGVVNTKVVKIDARAFENAPHLQVVEIPNSVSIIGEYAFHGCKNINEIRNCSCCKKEALIIQKGAFMECIALKKILLNRATTCIGVDAFNSCENLEVFKGSIKEVRKNAFYNCNIRTLMFSNEANISTNSIENSSIQQLVFSGHYYLFSKMFLDWMKKSGVKIQCNRNSNIANLAYEGFQIKIT